MIRFLEGHTFSRAIVLVILGDVAVFLAFVVLGQTEHETFQSAAFVRTSLPFAAAWLAISPWLGAYRSATLCKPLATAWRIPLIWLLCGSVALLVRVLVTDRPFVLSFAIVALAVQGVLLLGWRGAFMTVTRRFSRP